MINRLFAPWQADSDRAVAVIEPVTLQGQISPRLSICIPTYNGEKYLAEAISSILRQTYSDFELIIVDDCSTDATEAVIRSFPDSRLKYSRNSVRQGLVGNWNRCLQLSSGTYICIFHQDDVMLPENLAQKAKILDENPEVGLVYSDVYQINARGHVTARGWFCKAEVEASFIAPPPDFFEELISGKNLICCPSVLTRRECYERLGGFDLNLPFSTDWEMWLRIALFYGIAYLAEPLLKYRVHEANETHKFKGLAELEQYYLCKMLAIERYPERVPNYQLLKARLIYDQEQQVFDRVFRAYQQRQYDKATEALAFAATLHLTTSILPEWDKQYIDWLQDTTQALWKATAVSSNLPPQNLSYQATEATSDDGVILNQLSGEEIARHLPLRRLIQALAFKVANQPGLGYLYRFRNLGKKILGDR